MSWNRLGGSAFAVAILVFAAASQSFALTTVFNQTFDAASVPTGWLFQGTNITAAQAFPGAQVNLNNGTSQAGSLFFTQKTVDTSDNWILKADIYTWNGTANATTTRGDGLAIAWIDAGTLGSTANLLGGTGNGLGLYSSSNSLHGYAYEFDEIKDAGLSDPGVIVGSGLNHAYAYTEMEQLSGTAAPNHLQGLTGSGGTPTAPESLAENSASGSLVNASHNENTSGLFRRNGWSSIELDYNGSTAGTGNFVFRWGPQGSTPNSTSFEIPGYTTYTGAYFGFTAGNGATGTDTHAIDNVQLQTPEPTSSAVLLTGLLMVGGGAWRARRRSGNQPSS